MYTSYFVQTPEAFFRVRFSQQLQGTIIAAPLLPIAPTHTLQVLMTAGVNRDHVLQAQRLLCGRTMESSLAFGTGG